MADREVGTYREGDLIRVTNRETGEGFQARARKCPDATRTDYRDTLFLSDNWAKPWEQWIFLGYYLNHFDNMYRVELIEPAPDPLPTEPGYYLVTFDNDERVWEFGNGDWFEVNTNPNTYTKPEGFVKIERLYTKSEVMARYRVAAFRVNPDWGFGGPLTKAEKNLEEAL